MSIDYSISLNNPLYKHLSELVILWAISEKKELTGYQIKKTYDISKSHRILKKLAENQFLEERVDTQSGRLQKKYKITSKGRDRLSELITEWDDKFSGMNSILNVINPNRDSEVKVGEKTFENIHNELKKRKKKDEFINYLDDYLTYLRIINNKSYQLKKRLNFTIKDINQSELFQPENYIQDVYDTLVKITSLFDDIIVPEKISSVSEFLKSIEGLFSPFGGIKKSNSIR